MSQRLAEPSVMQIQHANFGRQRRLRREIPLGAGIWGTRDEMVGVMMHVLEMQWNLAPLLDCQDVRILIWNQPTYQPNITTWIWNN